MKEAGYNYYDFSFHYSDDDDDDDSSSSSSSTASSTASYSTPNTATGTSWWSFPEYDDVMDNRRHTGPWHPSPAPTHWNQPRTSNTITWDTERVIEIEFDIKLCDCPCNGFEENAAFIVATDGVFRSRGERAVAFALAANVRGVSAPESIQDPDQVSVVWSMQNKRKDKKQNDCSTELRVQMQVPLESVHVVDASGKGLTEETPAVVAFYQQVMQEVDKAMLSGNFKFFLDEALFPIGSVCETPSKWSVRY